MNIEQEIKDKITTYPWDIVEGRIISCNHIKSACKRFIEFLHKDEYYFDIDAVQRVINFTSKLKHFTGKYNSAPFILEEWQKFIYCGVYGFKRKDNGLRVTRTFILSVGRKNGKDQSLDTEIYTANRGWQTFGTIEVGDIVFDENGKKCNVTGKTDVFTDHKCYELTFRNGEKNIAGKDHNWVVTSFGKKQKVMTTEEIYKSNWKTKHSQYDDYTSYSYKVPKSPIIQFDSVELPFDPYTFGVWLGDGTSSKIDITIADYDTDILDYVIGAIGEPVNCYIKKETKCKTYSWSTKSKLGVFLKSHNLIENKHIPDVFIYNSVENRLALLQGLLDTDGYISHNYGQIEIQQKNTAIADGICQILDSLGIKYSRKTKTPTIDGVPKHTVERIIFVAPKSLQMFRLKRKFDLQKDTIRNCGNYIVDIKPVDTVPTRCITVDSPSHLYCFGRHFTVTHNSSILSAMSLYALFEEASACCVVAANSAAQAKILFSMASNYLKSIDKKGKYFRRYRDRILFDKTNSEIRVVASDASRLDGLNCSFIVEDETAAAPDSSVWDVLESSQGSREQPLCCSCSTRGFQLSGFYKELEDSAIEVMNGLKEDDSLFSMIYTLDEGDDYKNPDVWGKANPNLGVSVTKEFIQQQIVKAKNSPVQELSIKTKLMNMWVSSSDSWIPLEYIYKNMQKVNLDDYKDMFSYVSFDLASVCDLTALNVMIPIDDKFVMKTWYYLPADSIENNPNAERYKRWIQQGYLTMTEGNVTDYDYVINDIYKIQEKCPITRISYDQWNSTDMIIRLTENNMPLEPYSQSMASMNLPTKTLERWILQGKVILDKNPITVWCYENAKTKLDYNDNVKIIKNSVMQKIDGVISHIMCVGGYMQDNHYDNMISGTN